MKILLISDSSMNINKGGFQQTLYNIFSFLQPADFLFVTSMQANKIAKPSPPFTSRVITYNLQVIPVQQNRLDNYINSFITRFNFIVNYKFNRFKSIQKTIKKFNPDVVVVAPNGAEGVIIYDKLKNAFKSKKVFPYFMDDWLYQLKLNRFGNYIHKLTKQLLLAHTSWLMISENLTKILADRYLIQPAKLLVLHNPVDINNINPTAPLQHKNEYIIAYAGALWAMHFDAFLVIAKAIQILQKERKIKLVVYTGQSNWDWRKEELQSFNIKYGGHIPYERIHATLSEADYFLLTSSFIKEWQTHSKGSVQTKITDYLKSGRLIISCGPSYAANNDFLKKYNCGVCIETNDASEAATQLNKALNNLNANQQYIQRGYELLKNEFSFTIVHERFKKYLAA